MKSASETNETNTDKFLLTRPAVIIQILASVVSFALGLAVIIGWHNGNVKLVQIQSTFVPMAYNTAVCFVLCGAALLLASFGRYRLVIPFGLIVLIFGLLTVIQYAGNLDFRADYLLMNTHFGGEINYRIKMAFNTGLCFILIGLVLFIVGLEIQFKRQSLLLGIIGAIVCALGTDAFYGYFSGIKIVYGGEDAIPMAIHTAVGFTVLGIGIIAMAWSRDSKTTRMPQWIPVVIAIGGLTAAVCLWRALNAVEEMNGNYSALPLAVLVVGIGAVFLLALLTVMRDLRKSRSALLANVKKLKLSENARRKAEDYQTLFQLANDSILIFEPGNEVILDVNDKACETYGFARDEFIGKSLKELSQDVERGEEHLTRLLADGNHHSFESVNFRADGTPIYFLINASLIEYQGRQAVLSINRDIIERKRAIDIISEGEEWLRTILDGSRDGIIIEDVTKIIYVNTVFSRLFGYIDTEELIGKDVSELLPPDEAERLAQFGQKRLRGEDAPSIYEFTGKRKDGTTVEVEAAVSTSVIGGKRYIMTAIRDITERKESADLLEKNLSLLTSTFEATADGILVVDLTNTIVTYNRQFIEMWQIPDEIIESRDNEKTVNFVLNQLSNADEFAATTKKLVAHPEIKNFDILNFKDGKIYERYSYPQMLDGKVMGRVLSFRDITLRTRAEAELRDSENKFRMLVESTSEGILQVDNDDRTQFVNNRLCEMVGYSQEELLGINWCALLLDQEGCNLVNQVNERRRKGISDRYELRLTKKSGEILWVIVGAAPIINSEGVVTGSMGVFTDITERKRAEEQLLHDAFHDGLTGLANRSLFMDHLRLAVERGKSRHSNLYAVLFLDFDRFKVVNDSLGHAEGDKLLKQIARRLESCTRTGDLLARLGGDEFVILLNELVEEEDAVRVAERIKENLKTPFDLSGHQVFTSASIGITLSTSGHARAEDMLRDADIAMYRAKSQGKAQHQLFNQAMHDQASVRLRIENELRRAVEQQEFRLHYQPIINLQTNKIVGFESLVRWQHPERGIVPPTEFIPIAEETGLILPLGEWVLRESCRQLREWQEENPSNSNLTMSVNLSCKQFIQADLAEQIGDILRETKVKAENLRLEVTESYLIEDNETAITIMNRLHALGVKLSIDDFGTGYSSLSYLHRLPVHYLKIDRSFVSRMQTNPENAEIVRTIIMLAKNLNIEVIAEGIETIEQSQHLKNLDCNFGQGFLFSHPVIAEIAERLINDFPADNANLPETSDLNLELINNVEH